MPLKAFYVQEYRSFVGETEIELRPLTLLYGYNSAGKSSLLRTLPLVAASTDQILVGPLALDTEATRGATFGDLKTRLTAGFQLSLGVSWDDGPDEVRHVRFVIRDLQGSLGQIVEEVHIKDARGEPSLVLRWDTTFAPDGSPTYTASTAGNVFPSVALAFAGLLPPVTLSGLPLEVAHRLEVLGRRMLDLRLNLHWLTCVRSAPRRYFTMRSTRRRELSPTGEDAASYLAEDHARQGRLLQHVSAWYEKATGHRVTLLDEADRFRIVLSPLDNAQVEVDLIDTGEGMAQVLPVLVLIARAIEGYLAFGPTIAIEHPELHLHPRAERELASLFCSLARLRSSRVLIETHSQNFLLQVQLALLASTLTPEDVIVYWIRELPDGQGVVDRIVFDELAVPVGNAWPPDVFGEELAQAREILLARRNKA